MHKYIYLLKKLAYRLSEFEGLFSVKSFLKIRFQLICFIGLVSANMAFAQQANTKELNGYLQLINQSIEERTFERATRQIDSMVQNQSSDQAVRFYDPFLRGKISIEIKGYSNALDLLNKAEVVAFRMNRQDWVLATLKVKGSLVFRTGNYMLSLQISREALAKAEELKDSISIGFAKNDIGGVYFKINRYQEALSYFDDALKTFERIARTNPNMTYWIQNDLDNIALCYDRLSDPVNAEKYYLKAIRECYATNNILGASVAQVNLGKMLSNMRQFSRALPLLERSVTNAKIADYRHFDHASQANFELARVLVRLNRATEAERYLEIGYDFMQRRDLEFLHDYFLLKSEIYDLKGDYTASYRTIRKFVHIHDSLKKVDATKEFNKESLGIEFQKKETENKLLINNLEIEKLKDREEAIFFSFIGFVILSLLATVVYYRRSTSKLTELNGQIIKNQSEVQFANASLQRADGQKNMILATVAHDLRSLIGGMLVGTRTLKRSVQKAPSENGENIKLLDLMDSTANQSLQIVEDLVDMKALEDGAVSLQKQLVFLQKIVADSADSFQYLAAQNHVKTEINIDPGVRLPADATRLKRVLENLISNAIRFNKLGGHIWISAQVTDHTCTLSVRDEGSGMEPHILSKIFDPFFKGTKKHKSTGLGLSIVKQLVELHGGKVWVESEPGSGSTFFVQLPMA